MEKWKDSVKTKEEISAQARLAIDRKNGTKFKIYIFWGIHVH